MLDPANIRSLTDLAGLLYVAVVYVAVPSGHARADAFGVRVKFFLIVAVQILCSFVYLYSMYIFVYLYNVYIYL